MVVYVKPNSLTFISGVSVFRGLHKRPNIANFENSCQKDLHIFMDPTLSRKTSAHYRPPSDFHVRSATFLMSEFVLRPYHFNQ